MRCHLVNLVWIGFAPNSTILIIYVPFIQKWAYLWSKTLTSWLELKLVQAQVSLQYSPCCGLQKAELLFVAWYWLPWVLLHTFPDSCAMFSLDRAFRWRVGVGWLFAKAGNPNLSTNRRIVILVGRLCKTQKGESSWKVHRTVDPF